MSERRNDSQGAQVHQETKSGEGNYHSAASEDGSGGRFISVGSSKDHTTFRYDSKGKFEGKSSRGTGGNAKNAKP